MADCIRVTPDQEAVTREPRAECREAFPNFIVDRLSFEDYEALPSIPMKSLQTYPIHSQATTWSRCAGMCLRGATYMRPVSANEDLTKEAGR